MASDGTLFIHKTHHKGIQLLSFQKVKLYTTTVLYKWCSAARVTLHIRTTGYVIPRAGGTGGLLLIYNRLRKNCMRAFHNTAYTAPFPISFSRVGVDTES